MVSEVKAGYPQNGASHFRLTDDGLLIEHYFVRDPQVLCRLQVVEPENIDAELQRILAVGSMVLNNASPMLDSADIRREMEVAAQSNAKAIKEDVADALQPLLSDDGAFVRGLAGVKATLDAYLDPEKATSIYTGIESTVKRVVARALDPDDGASPMGRAVQRLVKGQEQAQEKIVDLYGKVAGLVERRDEREASTRKGEDYQEAVFEELARIAAVHGDSFEPAPNTAGTKSPARRGDGIVTVNPELTQGVPVRIVFEAGDRAQVSENSVLTELDGAKDNREAVAGVMILPSPSLGALRGRRVRPFAEARFACVLDKETWDALPLEVTYVMAKMAALKAATPTTAFAGVASEVLSLAEKALRQLDKADGVRTHFRKASEGISAAESLVTEVKAEVRATLTQVVALLQAQSA